MRDARTFLFVPGDRPERFVKAQRSGADVVIVDLEDAVAPAAKPAARAATAEALRAGAKVAVRVSAAGTPDLEADVAALAAARPPLAVVLAKAESADAVARVGAALGAPVVPLVESAAGLVGAGELAAVPGVPRLAFGALDLSLDLDAVLDPTLLDHARIELVVRSRAAGIAGPLDSPAADFTRLDVVAQEARRARSLGMGGKLCIHPAQVGPVAEAFRPTPEQVEHARRILAAAQHDGATADSGAMVDRPVLEQAQRLLARAQAKR